MPVLRYMMYTSTYLLMFEPGLRSVKFPTNVALFGVMLEGGSISGACNVVMSRWML